MKVTREMLHQMLDQVSDCNLHRIYDLLQSVLDGDEYITDSEKLEVSEARQRINSGEFVSLESIIKECKEKE
ncbi:hypothetical protein [Bacillus sp. FSL R9-9410]|uniref:hypothetical protein n=1 Tax=Bacillus sp. FSL R9-9410 TaxID=2921590 RepID=UPI003101A911